MLVPVLAAAALAGPYDVITRANLGHAMRIGSLYHAGHEEAVAGLLTQEALLKRYTRTDPKEFLEESYSYDDAWSSKTKLVDVSGSASVKINVLLAQAKVSIGMGYLRDKRSSSRQIRMSFKSTINTEYDSLDVFHPEVVMAVNATAVQAATHVVTGVVWGQRNIGQFESLATSFLNIKETSVSVKAKVKVLFSGWNTIYSEEWEKKEKSQGSNYTEAAKVYSDSVPAEYPRTFNETMEYIKNAMRNLKGRGVPVLYELTPIAAVAPGPQTQLVWDISDQYVTEAQRVLDEAGEAEVLIQDLLEIDAHGNRAWEGEVGRYLRRFRSWKAGLTARLDDAMTEVRLGRLHGGSIPAVLSEYWQSEFPYPAVAAKVARLRTAIENYLSFAGALGKQKVTIVTSAADLAAAKDLTFDRTLAVALVDNGGRTGVGEVKAFADYAAGKVADTTGAGHCEQRVSPSGAVSCAQRVQLLALHFDSYCTSVCPPRFCFKSSENATAQRACRTLLGPGGTGAEECALSAEQAGAEACWVRPSAPGMDVNASNASSTTNVSSTTNASSTATVNASNASSAPLRQVHPAFSLAWCACPYTMTVSLTEGEEGPVSLSARPAAPVIEAVVDDRTEADPSGQVVLLQLRPPPAPVLRYRVTALYRSSGGLFTAETGKDSYEVGATFETQNNDTNITVPNLVVGRDYRFTVAGVARAGGGDPSEPYPENSTVSLAEVTCAVAAVGLRGADAGGALGALPHGEISGEMPSWAAGGAEQLVVSIAVSAGLPERIARVAFRDSARGREFECADYTGHTPTGVTCMLPMRAAFVNDAAADATLDVRVYDVSGRAAATGTVAQLAAGTKSCALFEMPERVHLCEARVDSVATVARHDPLDQFAELEIHAGDYQRGVAFRGWRVVAQRAGEAASEHDIAGVRGRARVGGLRAGASYQFWLRARHANGALSEGTAPFPPQGHTLPAMPIITPRGAAGPRNRVPGWRAAAGGRLAIDVALTQPAPATIAAVEFKAANGTAAVKCGAVAAAGAGRASCDLPLRRLNEGGVPGVFGRDVRVVVLDASRNVMAEGRVARDALSGTACREWDPERPLHCDIGDTRLARCVSACGACAAPGRATHQVGQTCIQNPCADGTLLCPADPEGPCIPRRDDQPDKGCGSGCYGAAPANVSGDEICAPPCEPVHGVVIKAGETGVVTCPVNAIRVQGNATLPSMHCPAANTQRHLHDRATGLRAPWGEGLRVPLCEQCSSGAHCGGRAARVRPDAAQTRCDCDCSRGYAGAACGSCAAGYARGGGGVCYSP